jgi:hypothetical protein
LEGGGACDALSPVACLEFGDGFNVEIEQVAGEDTQREIGAGVVGGAVVDGVDRVEGDKVELRFGGELLCELNEIGEVAGAPIAVAAQGGEEAVDAVELLIGGGGGALGGGEDPVC